MGNLKNTILHFILSVCLLTAATGCEEKNRQPETAGHTLFMYFPWSDNLTAYFDRNIADMLAAVNSSGLDNQRVVIYYARSEEEATLYEIVRSGKQYVKTELKHYQNPATNTPAGVADILKDVKESAPAFHYSMTIGSHGMGWIPVSQSDNAARQRIPRKGKPAGLLTRYFGGLQPSNQIDIKDFAAGAAEAGIYFDYILFDDCYMSSVEAVFDLRHIADFVVASPTEMMAAGLPYAVIGENLLGDADLKAVCDGFYSFYASSYSPYATLAVTDCRQLDRLADLMKDINARHTPDNNQTVQRLDGFHPSVFFDLGDYVEKLCTDEELLSEFRRQLQKTVVYEVHTPDHYSMSGGVKPLPVCSGLSISDPSTNSLAAEKTETTWWKATH